jgi:hypothetical protein
MEIEICTISLGNVGLDNDYTFYDNGKIKRFYDKNTFSLSHTEILAPSSISDSTKLRLVDRCLDIHKQKIAEILY